MMAEQLWVLIGGDRDEKGTSAIRPGASSFTLDAQTPIDEDRDGLIDEEDAVDALTWYADNDGDGYGDPATRRSSPVHSPSAAVSDDTDCDDNRC